MDAAELEMLVSSVPETAPKPLKLRELKIFASGLSQLLDGGVPVLKALKGLEKMNGPARFKSFISRIILSLEQGMGLAQSLENTGAVPAFFSQSVFAGEASGATAGILKELAEYLGKEEALKRKIREAVIYPAFILSMGILTLAVLFQVVLPKLAGIYRDFGTELPLITRMVLAAGKIFPAVSAAAGLTLCCAFLFLKRKKQKLIRLFLKVPPAGELALEFTRIRFAKMFSLLVESGIPVMEALGIIRKTFHGSFFESDIEAVREKLAEGRSFKDSLAGIRWMDSFSGMLVASGEESGRLTRIFAQIAQDTQAVIESRIEWMLKLLEPILIVTIGLVIGFVVIATVLPIFDISGLMQ